MPRFPVPFGKRRSTADSFENGPAAEPSFRVLERHDASNTKSFDGGARLSALMAHDNGHGHGYHGSKPNLSVDLTPADDNMFADLKSSGNRGSGLSNNTAKSSLTDNSSRHSNASTAPSSTTDHSSHDDPRTAAAKKPYADIPLPPVPKSSSTGFLKAAGRTFSFGTSKKNLPPPPPADELSMSKSPEQLTHVGRPRTTTSSTASTATPPKLEEEVSFDLGGDFSKMLSFEKRQSVLTLKDDQAGRQALGPRSLTAGRLNQPTPLKIDRSSHIEPSPFSWGSHHSGEQLLPSPSSGGNPPPPPKQQSQTLRPQGPSQSSSSDSSLNPGTLSRRMSGEGENEDTSLLKDISTATKFLKSNNTGTGRYRRNEDTLNGGYKAFSPDLLKEDEDLFDTKLATSSKLASRYVAEKPSPPRTKVMTPAQFERYRQDKERHGTQGTDSAETSPVRANDDDDDEDDINYEDDEDEIEKSKQAAKQRQKQEAHMTVYRQQMMKVTGEPATGMPTRPGIAMSFSTPNLLQPRGPSPGQKSLDASDVSEEDEEVPLAILAAHGFPNKNRPPVRLTTMMSNPNLRAATQTPSYQRPGSVVGDPASAGPAPGAGGRLPAFARNLPQDPFVGAGLVNAPMRESLSFGGGSPAPGVPPGGLIGVIAGEERARAMRRGSPAIDGHRPMLSISSNSGFDPLAGIPSNNMYPSASPAPQMPTADHTQMQMNQQMQLMQMQMQFMQMQMMAGGGAPNRMSMMPGQMGMMGNPMMGGSPGGMMMGGNPMMGGMMQHQNPDAMRHSFIDNGSVFDLPVIRPDQHGRSMSMVQSSSASWVQPPPMHGAGYAPSIRIQGANGYAPSIAPSERSNVGLPGRYRPVSQMPAAAPTPVAEQSHMRKSSTMSAMGWDQPRAKSPLALGGKGKGPALKETKESKENGGSDDEDDEEAWAAMKQKREKKKSLWKTKKSFGSDIAAFIK